MKRTLMISVAISLALAGVAVAQTSFIGAAAIKDGQVPFQKKATEVSPSPMEAKGDRGRAEADGCMATGSNLHSGPCQYGDTSSSTTVVLFGDSRALSFSPAMELIAEQKGWRLVVLSRGNCPFIDLDLAPVCNQWRENSYKRIENVENPDIIIAASATKYWYGQGRAKAMPKLVAASRRGLERLRRTGADVVLMRDQSMAMDYRDDYLPGNCVQKNIKRLARCAFPAKERESHPFELLAAREAKVPVIDTHRHVCRPELCPAVIGNVIAYRDGYHYSATFMKTLAPWIKGRLESILSR